MSFGWQDLASCLSVGSLLLDKRQGLDIPVALLVGYGTSALGFLLCCGPALIAGLLSAVCDATLARGQRIGRSVAGGTLAVCWVYLVVGAVLICLGVDLICLGYTGHIFDELPQCQRGGGGGGMRATLHNNSSRTLFLIGDQRTTIASYRARMARFTQTAEPFLVVGAGETVDFDSAGDFETGDENAGVTFWLATGCDRAGHCSWNSDRTQGALLEWNVARGTLYYDLSAVEAMDSFSYTMRTSCDAPSAAPRSCHFDMAQCVRAPTALVHTPDGVSYCNAPKRVCLADDLGGTEANSCTDNPRAVCSVWDSSGKSADKVYYQEYAQTAGCGCVGCNAGPPSDAARCKTMAGGPLSGCTPTAAQATPYVKEMRRNCHWGYAYPFDDLQAGLTCDNPTFLEMTVADGTAQASRSLALPDGRCCGQGPGAEARAAAMGAGSARRSLLSSRAPERPHPMPSASR